MINKLQTLLMKCAHKVLGYKSYKMTTIKIMSNMKLLTIHHMIIYESILFFHKVIFNNSPDSITKLITYSINDRNNVRSCRKPIMMDGRKIAVRETDSDIYHYIGKES